MHLDIKRIKYIKLYVKTYNIIKNTQFYMFSHIKQSLSIGFIVRSNSNAIEMNITVNEFHID